MFGNIGMTSFKGRITPSLAHSNQLTVKLIFSYKVGLCFFHFLNKDSPSSKLIGH